MPWCHVMLGSEIIFIKFDLQQFIRAWIIAFFMLIRYVTLPLWPLTRWPWKFVVHQASRDQTKLVVLLIILGIFLPELCHSVTLTFDLLTLNFYSTLRVTRLNSTKFEQNQIIHGWLIDDIAPRGDGAPYFLSLHFLIFCCFLLFAFFGGFNYFSSFVHPFPFYQNSPTLFPGRRS